MRELEELCGGDGEDESPVRSVVSSPEVEKGGGAGGGYEGDEEVFESVPHSPLGDEGEGGREGEGGIPLELELALREIESQYRSFPPSASSSPSSSLSHLPPASSSALTRPRAVRPSPTTGQGRYSYEVSIEETTTTTTETRTETRTIRRARMPGEFDFGGETGSGSEDASMHSLEGEGRGRGYSSSGGEEDWDELVGRGEEGYETAEDVPSAPDGETGTGRGRTTSVAGLSRIETLERPEESRQKLTVRRSSLLVLSFLSLRRTTTDGT